MTSKSNEGPQGAGVSINAMSSAPDGHSLFSNDSPSGAPLHDLRLLLDVLPAVVRERLLASPAIDSLVEVVLDYGRPAEARFHDRVERMPDVIISEHDIEYVTKSIGEFGSDNRAGIERTLHRVSAIRSRHGRVIGLTCRVGRALEGTIDMIDGIVRSGQSILLLGKPGVGKTTKLREIARVLADEVGKRVVIVDTSNEIAGDGDVPHPGIGSARRMQVRVASEQHSVMIEAVENHMPEVIVIDEIGTEAEAAASRTIAERGVQLIGTAHGQTLENLMLNPTLCDLVGGIQAVTLSDAEAARRGTQKTVLERKAPPTFDVVIELLDYERLAVHHDVQKTVDMILRGVPPRPEGRVRTRSGEVEIVQTQETLGLDSRLKDDADSMPEPIRAVAERLALNGTAEPPAKRKRTVQKPIDWSVEIEKSATKPMRIYPYGINRARLDKAIRDRRLNAVPAIDIAHADGVIIFRSTFQQKPRKIKELAGRSVPTAVVRSNTYAQIAEALDQLLNKTAPERLTDEEEQAAAEVMAAIQIVAQTGKPFELAPRSGPIRRVQHRTAEASRMASESVGQDPKRRIRILPIQIPMT